MSRHVATCSWHQSMDCTREDWCSLTVFGWSLSNFAVVNIIGTRAILQPQERGNEREAGGGGEEIEHARSWRLISREKVLACKERKKKPLRKGREIAWHPLLFSLVVLWVWLMEREGTEASAQHEEAKWGQCRTSIPLSVIWVYLSLYIIFLFTSVFHIYSPHTYFAKIISAPMYFFLFYSLDVFLRHECKATLCCQAVTFSVAVVEEILYLRKVQYSENEPLQVNILLM